MAKKIYKISQYFLSLLWKMLKACSCTISSGRASHCLIILTKNECKKQWMVFKSLNGLVPEYLKSKFRKRNESNYSLRDPVKKLLVPFPKTNYLKNSFSCSGETLWNSLPCNIRESGSLNQFKRLLYHNFWKHDIYGNQVFTSKLF